MRDERETERQKERQRDRENSNEAAAPAGPVCTHCASHSPEHSAKAPLLGLRLWRECAQGGSRHSLLCLRLRGFLRAVPRGHNPLQIVWAKTTSTRHQQSLFGSSYGCGWHVAWDRKRFLLGSNTRAGQASRCNLRTEFLVQHIYLRHLLGALLAGIPTTFCGRAWGIAPQSGRGFSRCHHPVLGQRSAQFPHRDAAAC